MIKRAKTMKLDNANYEALAGFRLFCAALVFGVERKSR